jgi:NifU-like protein involved in Fe-S cluster formation
VTAGPGYPDRVRELFLRPAHAGSLSAGPGHVVAAAAAAPERGAWLEVVARVEADRVVEARFRAWGCPHFIAACELAVARLEGRPLAEAAGLEPAALARELGVPAEKLGRLLVVEDVLSALAATRAESK